ncbi:acyltransferase [Chryseobacterium sp. G0162]|uniref:acyltransferase family protein n=1 Tax=Chryseobacterium sp. G0162 TaxID=2487063 RepID=UPI000F51330C|nr:acyltransferase [Chryseobacterium sp. G0162]AZB10281.1 acyltransferase [Chryseobacterium sp. G0162]
MSVDALNPIFFVLILVVGILSSFVLQKLSNEKLEHVKYLSIDGLRGYLAFFVFIGHSAIWYFYLKNGIWTFVNSKLFYASASISVLFFFMITSFLFFLKLYDNKTKPIDWVRLYISRCTRLMPLYYFAFFFILFFVFVLSNFKLNVPPLLLIRQILQWLSFNLLGITDINACKETTIIIAQVVWSLQYEWLFYFSLPLLNLIFFRSKSNTLIFIISTILFSVFTVLLKPDVYYFYIFTGGVIAAYAVRKVNIKNPNTPFWNSILLILIFFYFLFMKVNEHQYWVAILLFAIFLLIAIGNTLFGLLTTKFSRFLGQISYSIYLLHPILLFTTFKFIIPYEFAKNLSPLEYWLIIAVLTPILISICYLTFKKIEEPIMKKTGKITSLIQKK